MIELSEETKEAYRYAAKVLKGSDRRLFMARIVKSLGHGGRSYAHKHLGWDPKTVDKGLRELASGIVVIDNFSARGRKSAEEHFPHLLDDIRQIVDAQSQTDPTFRTTRLYTRLTSKQVRQQLIEQKGYQDEDLPCEETLRVKLNKLGYKLRSVKKSQPKKNTGDRPNLPPTSSSST